MLIAQAALEARGHNIRVNAVSPGWFMTDLLKPIIERGDLKQDFFDACEQRQGRAATFDEVGDVVVLLSTPRMSKQTEAWKAERAVSRVFHQFPNVKDLCLPFTFRSCQWCESPNRWRLHHQ